MLTILGGSGSNIERLCDGVSRRGFLKVGGMALGGLSLGQLLELEAAAGTGSSHKALINIYLPGGPSHIDLWDLKPDAPSEIRGEFRPIKTNVSGMEICELFPKLAKIADKFSIIRSMHSYSSKHGEGDVDIMCGSPRDKNLQAPGIGAVLSLQQKQQSQVPPFVHLGDMKHPAHSAPEPLGFRLASRHSQRAPSERAAPASARDALHHSTMSSIRSRTWPLATKRSSSASLS